MQMELLLLPINFWCDYMEEPTLADVIIDRLAAYANKIEHKRGLLRKKIYYT